MLAGVFQRNLRKLNPKLRIWCGDDDSKPASIFYVKHGEFEQVCGIDKNWIPENTQFEESGAIKKGGWRRAVRILIQKRLVDRRTAERVFNTHFPYAPRKPKAPVYKPPSTYRDLYGRGMLTQEEFQAYQKGK